MEGATTNSEEKKITLLDPVKSINKPKKDIREAVEQIDDGIRIQKNEFPTLRAEYTLFYTPLFYDDPHESDVENFAQLWLPGRLWYEPPIYGYDSDGEPIMEKPRCDCKDCKLKDSTTNTADKSKGKQKGLIQKVKAAFTKKKSAGIIKSYSMDDMRKWMGADSEGDIVYGGGKLSTTML